MQHFLCPQCGAMVGGQAPGQVMVVCPACRSTITRDADAARRVGQLSEVVDDGSPVRIGTRGALAGHSFEVIGRLRLQYDEGGWNEWYVLFDAGGHGWLSDASGQYALTRPGSTESPMPLPAFDALSVGTRLKLGGVLYTVADVRRSRCVGGEGELPVHAGDGWEVASADLRGGRAFATLDYSDDVPMCYAGQAGERLKLDPQTLRSREEIIASAGRVRGQLLSLDCPQCAAPISVAAAVATQVVCSACGSVVDCSGERAEVIEAHKRTARFKSSLPLGTSGQLAGARYTVIGILRCDVPEDASEPAWTEYLLLDAQQGYRWLVETQTGWQLVAVCDEWPVFDAQSDASCRYQGGTWSRTYTYGARVKDVFGAFNWRVRRGDRRQVTDYAHGGRQLTCEESAQEITWSLATPVPPATVSQAFSVSLEVPAAARPEGTDDEEEEGELGIAQIGIFGSVGLMLLQNSISFGAMLVGIALIWLPPLVMWLRSNVLGEST